MKGTKRRLTCVAPVQHMIGVVGQTKGTKYDPERYGGLTKVVGYCRSYSTINRFAVRAKSGITYKDAATAQAAATRQAKFKAVAQSTRERMQDPNKRLVDAAAFKQQTKYATLYGYVFSLEWLAFDGE